MTIAWQEKFTKSKVMRIKEHCNYFDLQFFILYRHIMASYGGLLMNLIGDPTQLKSIDYDSRVFILIKKV